MSEIIYDFTKTTDVSEKIDIIRFVYEKEANFKQEYIYPSCYSLYYVMNGSGVLKTEKGVYPVVKGDMFFTFSLKPYYIQNLDCLQYKCISFAGLRALRLFRRTNIDYDHPVVKEANFLQNRWIVDINEADPNIDLKCESLLLFIFSFLCEPEKKMDGSEKISDGIMQVKTYIDLHYTESELTLKSVSEQFHYSAKYVSNAFIKLLHVSFSEYICDMRLDHAKQLLSCGVHTIQEVALSSGFSDAQYFSRIFKKRYGITPTEFIKNHN